MISCFWLIIVPISVLFHPPHSSDLFLTATQFIMMILNLSQCAIEQNSIDGHLDRHIVGSGTHCILILFALYHIGHNASLFYLHFFVICARSLNSLPNVAPSVPYCS
jgi:hypothetical protein